MQNDKEYQSYKWLKQKTRIQKVDETLGSNIFQVSKRWETGETQTQWKAYGQSWISERRPRWNSTTSFFTNVLDLNIFRNIKVEEKNNTAKKKRHNMVSFRLTGKNSSPLLKSDAVKSNLIYLVPSVRSAQPRWWGHGVTDVKMTRNTRRLKLRLRDPISIVLQTLKKWNEKYFIYPRREIQRCSNNV